MDTISNYGRPHCLFYVIVMAGYTGLASKVLRLLRSPRQQKYLNRGFAVMFSCAALLLSTVHQAS